MACWRGSSDEISYHFAEGKALGIGLRSCRSFAALAAKLPEVAAKLPLSGKIMGGVFCGVVRDLTRGIYLVSADVGCGVLVFVGFGGLFGRGI